MELFTLVAPAGEHLHTFWHHGGPWLFAPFFFWLWVGAAALGIYLWRKRPFAAPLANNRAMDILAERFAAGEISAEEYHDRLAQLR